MYQNNKTYCDLLHTFKKAVEDKDEDLMKDIYDEILIEQAKIK